MKTMPSFCVCVFVVVLLHTRTSVCQIVTAKGTFPVGNTVKFNADANLNEVGNHVEPLTVDSSANVVVVNTRLVVNECNENSVGECQEVATLRSPEGAPNLIVAAPDEPDEDDDEEEEDDDNETSLSSTPSTPSTESSTDAIASSTDSPTSSTASATTESPSVSSITTEFSTTPETSTQASEISTKASEISTKASEISTKALEISTLETPTLTEEISTVATEISTIATETSSAPSQTSTTVAETSTSGMETSTTAVEASTPTAAETSTTIGISTTAAVTSTSASESSSTSSESQSPTPTTSSVSSTEYHTTSSHVPLTSTETSKTSSTSAATTSATTTHSPIDITTAPPTEKRTDSICSRCKMENGIGYSPHPTECDRFYQCLDNGVRIVPVEKSCPFGLYWNQNILVCDYPNNVQCGQGVCSSGGYIPIPGNCRGFWDCYGGVAISKCCPLLMRFDALSGGCVLDVTCYDDCAVTPSLMSVSGGCDMRSVAGDKFSYEQRASSGSWILKQCPAFTVFNQANCGCALIAPSIKAHSKKECRPELLLTFDKDGSDSSGNNVAVENDGVVIGNGTASFHGKNSLTVHRFSNAWFGKTVLIHVRYKALGFTSRQGLVCNGDCHVMPSLYVGTTNTGSTEFFVDTYSSEANFTTPLSSSAWQDVTFKLQDGELQGTVGTRSISQGVKGAVETRQRALIIGGCEGAKGFHGIIDEVALYLCDPTRF